MTKNTLTSSTTSFII